MIEKAEMISKDTDNATDITESKKGSRYDETFTD